MEKRIVNCPHCGKILSSDLWEKQKTTNNNAAKCPKCGSTKSWKAGIIHTPFGEVQRYLCRYCEYRFIVK